MAVLPTMMVISRIVGLLLKAIHVRRTNPPALCPELLRPFSCSIVLGAPINVSALRRLTASPSTLRVRCAELIESPGICLAHRFIYLRLAARQPMERPYLYV
jgi:hypothetical protein